jgi:hypothetical protein
MGSRIVLENLYSDRRYGASCLKMSQTPSKTVKSELKAGQSQRIDGTWGQMGLYVGFASNKNWYSISRYPQKM